MATISVLNTSSDLSGKTVVTAEGDRTITGLLTITRGTSAPFAVSNTGAAVVTNLDADKLDGQHGAYYLALSNATGILTKVLGGTGIDSSAVTDGKLLIGKTSDTSWNIASLTAGAGIAVTNGAGAITVASQWVLLTANSGTNTSAVAANVDTIAISGLTAKDTLKVVVTIGSTTQATAAPRLYNSTDSVDILVSDANIVAGTAYTFEVIIKQRQTAATKIVASGPLSNQDTAGTAFSTTKHTISTFTQNWTGSWTLALRHAGVTAGGTCDWSWAVYKLVGQ